MWDEIPVHFLKMNSFSLQILLHFVGEKAVPDNSGPVTDQYRPALLTRTKNNNKNSNGRDSCNAFIICTGRISRKQLHMFLPG